MIEKSQLVADSRWWFSNYEEYNLFFFQSQTTLQTLKFKVLLRHILLKRTFTTNWEYFFFKEERKPE